MDQRKLSVDRAKEEMEAQLKKVNDSSLEKVVEKDNFLYFVTKDGKDKPLDSFFKMPVPDRRLPVKGDQIQNLMSILLRQNRRSGDESHFSSLNPNLQAQNLSQEERKDPSVGD